MNSDTRKLATKIVGTVLATGAAVIGIAVKFRDESPWTFYLAAIWIVASIISGALAIRVHLGRHRVEQLRRQLASERHRRGLS